MNCLQFNFSHPVKGHACLTRLCAGHPQESRRLEFDTEENADLVIPLDGFPGGKWKIVLEWEHEERCFTHTSEVDVLPEKTLFPAHKFADASLFHSKGALFSANGKYAAADSEI